MNVVPTAAAAVFCAITCSEASSQEGKSAEEQDEQQLQFGCLGQLGGRCQGALLTTDAGADTR